MEKGNLIRKYEGLFERNYINEVIKKFEKIRELLFYKEDLNKTIDQYLNYDKIVCEFNTSIKNLLGDIRKVENLKFELLNKSIIELRREGKLFDWLNNLNNNELMELKNIVNIDIEWRELDNYRFNESKKNRGQIEY